MSAHFPPCLEPPVDGQPWAPPLDVYDAAVRLETAGITDESARRQYGIANTMQLAARCLPWARLFPASETPEAKSPSILREYFLGTAFAIPLLMCSAAILGFGISLWGGDVAPEMAAAVGLGTVSSFVCSGGLVQAMARRCLFFLGVEDFSSAYHAFLRWAALGILTLTISGVLLYLLSSFFGWLPSPLPATAAAFHVVLGMFWIGTGALFLLERSRWSGVATAAGIAAVLGLHNAAGMALAAAQLAGILIASAVAFAAAWLRFNALRRQLPGVTQQFSPAHEIYLVWPYLLFGSLYFVLLFCDRVLAWTVPDFAAASPVQFLGDYETAIDLALVSFILQFGNVRASVTALFFNLAKAQKKYRLSERFSFKREMIRDYYARTGSFVALGAAASLLVYAGADWLGLLHDRRIHDIFSAALPGVALLVFSLWNTSILFRLSRPLDALAALGAGVAVDVVAGYCMTRLGGYWLASAAFTIAAVIFAAVSSYRVVLRLADLDYEYFASSS